MRLTVKASSTKLREATRSSSSGGREQFVGGEILEGKRPRHVKKSYVVESDSEDEDEDEEMDDVVDDDDEEEDEEDEEDEDEDADADADGDMDIDVEPPPPTIKVSKARGGRQSLVSAKSAPKAKPVAVKLPEVQLVSDDDELSELESEVAEEEAMQTGNEEEVEEEEEEEEDVDAEGEDDEEDESGDDTGMEGSRASTPDLNKLTKRQRARLEEGGSGHLLALPDGISHRSIT
jgi:Ino eighty subunit 2